MHILLWNGLSMILKRSLAITRQPYHEMLLLPVHKYGVLEYPLF